MLKKIQKAIKSAFRTNADIYSSQLKSNAQTSQPSGSTLPRSFEAFGWMQKTEKDSVQVAIEYW